MSINNPHLALDDFASFEPEAILASLPGEHPRMASALGIGREASTSGLLDVAALTRIVNDLYAEGFPAGSPLGHQTELPTTASLTHVAADAVMPGHSATPTGASIAMPNTTSTTPDFAYLDALALQHAPGVPTKLNAEHEVAFTQLISGLGIPYHIPLTDVLDGTSAIPPSQGSAATSPYYFLGESAFNPASTIPTSAHPSFDVHLIRKDFPILQESVNGRPLIWFDNAATTQKPQAVIDRISYFYQHENSNIHRAAHALAARATDAYEEARETVRRFINASSVNNIVFVRGTTEAINLVAKTWGKKHLGTSDEIVISHLEHHANIVPWQQLCQETGAKLKVAPVDESGQIVLAEYQKLLTSKVKLVAFTQVSNALGTVTPAKQMIDMAHRIGAKVLLDGAQSVSHMRTDVQALNADFFVFSGHKVFGPTGIGALYGKADVLDEMPVWQGGGNMIQDVTFENTIYHDAPAKFEAGTGNIADAVGMGAALQYVERIGIDNIARYEHALLVYATAAMLKVPGLQLVGTAADKASVLSFTLQGYKSEEVGAALNEAGIAVRSGHHCAQPILRRFGLETTVRPSLAFYNTPAEVDAMVVVLLRLSSQKA